MNKRLYYYVVTVGLGTITATLIYLAQTSILKIEISQVLMVISGMTLLATFSSLQGMLADGVKKSGVDLDDPVVIDEFLVSKAISSVTDKFHHDIPKELPSWEIQSVDLVGKDNALALAKLRIDIEREIRQIIDYRDLRIDMRRSNLLRILDQLTSQEVLPYEWLLSLKDIISICNRAVHGESFSDESTENVVNAGTELIKGLHSIKIELKEDPLWSLSEK